MVDADKLAQHCKARPHLLGAGLLAALSMIGLNGGASNAEPQEFPQKKQTVASTVMDVHFFDEGIMKLTLLDESVELVTRFGKLLIPVSEIRRVDFAWRIEDEAAKRIDAAVADLGNAEYRRREMAMKELTDRGLKAYPALLKASKNGDPEVARRAGELLEKLRQTVSAERLEVRLQDVIHTDDSRITGQLTALKFKVKTAQFGKLDVKLADIVSMEIQGTATTSKVLPDPGTLNNFKEHIGETFIFKVTGAPAGSQGAWGNGTYTMGSTLSVAAVHAGALQSGQTGPVVVTIVGPVKGFASATQNGITSSAYGAFAGYRIELGRK